MNRAAARFICGATWADAVAYSIDRGRTRKLADFTLVPGESDAEISYRFSDRARSFPLTVCSKRP